MQGTFTVTASDLQRILSNAAVFAGKGDTLPVLNAVRLELGEPDQSSEGTVTAVATDRYCIGSDTAPAIGVTAAQALLLNLDDVKRLIKACKELPRHGTSFAVFTVLADQRVEVVVGYDTTLTFRQVDGEFPRWRALFPDGDSYEAARTMYPVIAFDPAKLARFDKVLSDHRTDPLRITLPPVPTKPAIVERGDTFRGLVMPVRLAS